jgi:hypothetical protein
MILRNSIVCGLVLVLAGCDPSAKRTVSSSPAGEGDEPSSSPDAPAAPVSSLPAEVSFNEHIQPILSEYCYHCHGPDSKTREPKDAPLRLDQVEGAFAVRDDGRPVIIKGKPDESSLMKRLHAADPDMIMPPPKSHKILKPGEIALIERWIEQGAEYEPHWAFAPIKKPAPPDAGDKWAANPIDRFIAEKLDKAGLKPNPPEDPRRFHRRLTLDLTGLPPEPAATDAFVKAHEAGAQAAIEAEADRLLATPASAEHFTRHWLDAVRYADTHGIHIDNYRNIWHYRDWVIDAFQRNMPWDQFTTEQIAGDMLPDATVDQKVASGYNRCLATTGEGGAIADEYLAIYAKDRVETMTAVWLGLTAGCAACHDHKFDPVSTREFYQLTAFFRNSTMSALDGNNASHQPVLSVPRIEDRKRIAALEGEIAAARKDLNAPNTAVRADFDKWLAAQSPAAAAVPDPSLVLHLPLTEQDGPIHGTVGGQPKEFAVSIGRKPGRVGQAVVASGEPVDLGAGLGDLDMSKPFTVSAFLRIEGNPLGAVIARMDPAQGFRGWDLYLEGGRIGAHFIDEWPAKAAKFLSPQPLPGGTWQHVAITHDPAKEPQDAYLLWVNGEPAKMAHVSNGQRAAIHAGVPLRIGSRANGDSRLKGGEVLLQDLRIHDRVVPVEEIKRLSSEGALASILAIAAAQRTPAQNEALLASYMATHDTASSGVREKIAALENQRDELKKSTSDTLVMDEKAEVPFANILARGQYTAPGDRVTADTPAVLPPMAADAPKNRLGLARWLADPLNPLPARVTMNRTWYYFFGTGIVETTEDFGVMGARPSHPQLLDWLAAEFISSKWNYRHMLKLIATSAAYRQSGQVTPEKLEADHANRLLARGPRVRLDAEPIRDLVLAAAGLLSPKTGGPSVKPYQPEGIWEAVAMKESNTRNYKQDDGENLYRRSLYTMWKRTAAPPTMEIFNAPTREAFCVRRDRTNTPLQALVLLNDPQFVEASRELAAHALKAAADVDGRLDFITLRLIGRKLDPDERKIVSKTFDAALAEFQGNAEGATKLITTGATPPPKDAHVPELAAWTLVASQILNLDETITR